MVKYRCKDDNHFKYVGSTIQPLYKRWNDYKTKCNNETSKHYNRYLYVKMRELGINKFYIELYEDCSCKNKEKLNRKEGKIIRQIGTLNPNIAGRTEKEYYDENKSTILEKKKEYYDENKEIKIEKNKHIMMKTKRRKKNIILGKKKEYYDENRAII